MSRFSEKKIVGLRKNLSRRLVTCDYTLRLGHDLRSSCTFLAGAPRLLQNNAPIILLSKRLFRRKLTIQWPDTSLSAEKSDHLRSLGREEDRAAQAVWLRLDGFDGAPLALERVIQRPALGDEGFLAR
eukprot:CAMPEP_0195590550 /NCGR_PEP_ID=MMETSP0814-20130614/34199_1 /TAXON_ID=97485 /ORGANISM="Prymnesium parvum, Strain Texoma1" /LENGTH=127 /DNA_ID=CAMNT_0040729589 /DNA_START=285 /DNA_END=668 /DNA_ORIENTATION=-